MEEIETVCMEIEAVLNDICSEGVDGIDGTAIVKKLEELGAKTGYLRMKKGEELIKEFITEYKKYREGKTEIKQIAKNLMAMNFYVKNIIEYEDRSEL
jgi:carbamoylphosphate synthase small subunit